MQTDQGAAAAAVMVTIKKEKSNLTLLLFK